MFFNVFVFLQVFNFFNARTLKRAEINVFQDISDNYLFILIVIGIFITQIFIVQFGGKAFWLVPLNVQQHLICILIGALSLVMGFINKRCIPESIYSNFELLKEQQH